MTNPTRTKTFEMNGKIYRTDPGTLEVLRSVVPAAKAARSASARGFAALVMELCLDGGRIEEIK